MLTKMHVLPGQLCIAIVVLSTLLCWVPADCKIPLYIASLQELTDLPSWYTCNVNMPRVTDMTIAKINNNTDVLREYELVMITRDIGYERGGAVKIMTELLSEAPPKLMIFGPGGSDNLEITALVAPFYNLIEVAYFDTSAQLGDRSTYNTLFTASYSFQVLNPLMIKLMNQFGWARIGTVADTGAIFTGTLTHFHELLIANNKTMVATAVAASTIESATEIVKLFKQSDVRIIYMAVMGTTAKAIFCQAYHHNMYGAGYVWVAIMPMYLYREGDALGCTNEQLVEASDGFLALDYDLLSPTNTLTSYGEYPNDVMRAMEDIDNGTDWMLAYRDAFGIANDALWTIAYGLNNSIKHLEEQGLKIEDYNYHDRRYLDAVKRGMTEVAFNGVSGPVMFDDKGQRIGLTYIQKIVNANNLTRVDVVRMGMGSDEFQWQWLRPVEFLWSDGRVPLDRFLHVTVMDEPSVISFVIILLLDIIGIALTSFFLFFNVYYRNHRSVKMSSPLINNIILVGSFLMYIEVIIRGIDYIHAFGFETLNHFCMLEAWILSIAFTVLFGALFAKTYRVYVIFRSYKLQRRHIKDWHLFALLLGLISVDLCILMPWSIAHPMKKVEVLLSKTTMVKENVIESLIQHHCKHEDQVYYFAAVYVYKGLFLVFGAFLAWETRQVTVPELNDSKQIGACIYNVVVVCIFGVPLSHMLPVGMATLTFVLESCLIIFCTSICQCIIFLPKVKLNSQVQPRFLTNTMTQRQITEHVKDTSTLSTKHTDLVPQMSLESLDNDDKDIELIKRENKRLRMELAQESIAIVKLRRNLKEMTGNIHFYRSGSHYVLFKNGSTSAGQMNDSKTQDKRT